MKVLVPILALLLLAACAPKPETVTQGALTLSEGWAPVQPDGTQIAAGYLKIENKGDKEATLTGITSARAARVEMHVTTMAGGDIKVMMMKRVDRLTVPPHGELLLKPGETHLMIFAPSPPLKAGDVVPLRLTFDGKPVDYSLLVRAAEEDAHHQ